MANVLPKDKQIAVIAALAEGSSIRSIERMTDVHRDTIMRLGVRIGQGCAKVMDLTMRDLPCQNIQVDEIWGFVGKKNKNLKWGDNSNRLGDAWTFCAIDADTKLVPCFKVGKRDSWTANAFMRDLSRRLQNRVQLSSDALSAYVDAVERSFGTEVDYGQIVKSYTNENDNYSPERRYSPAEVVSIRKESIMGEPDMDLVSTSYVERLNATTRTHMKRLSRLTLAFSKKWEHFEAAVGLHFVAYNFVRRHATLRMTPAMAAGVEKNFWTFGDMVEMATEVTK